MHCMNNAVEVRSHGRVTVVTLSRPDVRNAVDADTALQLYEAFVGFEADPQARVAVFQEPMGTLCGMGLARGRTSRQEHASAADMRSSLNFSRSDGFISKRHLAAGPMGLHGSCRQAGDCGGEWRSGGWRNELALWCDMRVMEDDAYFGVYCRRFGVPLIDGGTVRLPRLIGMGHAMDLILTGRKVEPAEALAMGLCNRVVPTGQGLQAALDLAEQLAGFPQQTMLADRASAYAQWDLDMPQALQQEWERGKQCIAHGLEGAARFSSGAGRHGKF